MELFVLGPLAAKESKNSRKGRLALRSWSSKVMDTSVWTQQGTYHRRDEVIALELSQDLCSINPGKEDGLMHSIALV